MKSSFFKGAFLMIASACIVKVGGALFKIPLSSILGGSGMGLFMAAYSIFNPFHSVFASGISPAVSNIISRTKTLKGDKAASELGLNIVLFSLLYGIFASCVFKSLIPFVTVTIGRNEVLPMVETLVPCLFFCVIISAVRGIFEGCFMMVPSSFSQILEVAAKFILGLWLSYSSLRKYFAEFYKFGKIDGKNVTDLSEATCKVTELVTRKSLSGVAAASLISCAFLVTAYLIIFKKYILHPDLKSFPEVFKIFRFALPAAFSSLIISLYPTIDMYSFFKDFGFSYEKFSSLPKSLLFLEELSAEEIQLPQFLYGCYSGLAMTIFHFVPSVASSFSSAVLPYFTSVYSKRNIPKCDKVCEGILKTAAYAVMPMGVGMIMMSREILNFFFIKSPLEAMTAVPYLRILGIASVFVGLTSPAFAILQGMGKPDVPAGILFEFLFLKMLLNKVFMFIPGIYAFSAPAATLIAYVFIFRTAVKKLSSGLSKEIPMLKIIKTPLVLSIISCGLVKISFMHFSKTSKNPLLLVLCGLFGALIYIIFTFLTGEFKQEYIKILYCDKNK